MITDPDRVHRSVCGSRRGDDVGSRRVLPHLHRTVHAIKALGVKAGVVINPSTPAVRFWSPSRRDVDYVLVMSVNPGFGGQTFIPAQRVQSPDVRASARSRRATPQPVEIDGGIDIRNVGRVVSAGARMIVAGSAIFTHPIPSEPRGNSRAAALAAVSSPAVR